MMQFYFGIFVMAGLVSTICQPCFGVQPGSYGGLTVPETVVLPDSEVHPSLYFNADKFGALRGRRNSLHYEKLWREISKDALHYLAQDPEQQNYANRPRMAKTLAFWWLLEGSRVALAKSIAALSLAYDGVPRSGDLPYDEIRRATWLQNYCAAYDWLHDELTAEQDSLIRARVTDEVEWLRNNLTDGLNLAPGLHNHRLKPAYALGTAALTFSAHSQARDWMEYALAQQNEVTNYIISSDGMYREGGHYWMFVSVNLIPFLWQYFNVSGVDLFPYYGPFFEWPVKVRMGRGWIPNYEDSFLQPTPTYAVSSRYLDAPTSLHSSASLGNLLQWHFLNTKVHYGNYTGATEDVTWEIDEFILFDASIASVAPNSTASVKLEGGQIIFRNRWNGGDGHRYLLFQGVAEADYHNHPDQLSYLIEANDAYLITDAGYGRIGYPDPRRYTWYTLPRAHNIVTVDSLPPKDPARDVSPETTFFFESDFCGFAEKRAVYATTDSVILRRAIIFIDKTYWVVADILQGHGQDHQFRTYVHGRGDFERQDHHVSWTSQEDRYGSPGRIDVYLIPGDMPIQEATGYASLFKDETVETYVSLDGAGASSATMQILIPGLPADPPPLVRDASANDYLFATVETPAAEDCFFLQPNRLPARVDDFVTDATFVWIRRGEGELKTMAVREMTLFNGAGLEIQSKEPVTMAIDFGRGSLLDIHVDESRTDGFVLAISWLRDPPSGLEVVVNNAPVTFLWRNFNTIEIGEPQGMDKPDSKPSLPYVFKLSNFPNPFNNGTAIQFGIEREGWYTITIYDILGREVFGLAAGRRLPGDYQIRWAGQTREGRMAASGVYVAALRNVGSGKSRATKLLLVR